MMKVRGLVPALVGAGMLCIPAAQAQNPTQSANQDASSDGSATSQAGSTQGTPDQTAAQKLTTSDTVTVTAPGEARDVQSVSNELLQESAPGTSPLASLSRLPSVEITKADPYGAYEWALRINVRGFNQNQLGFTLDDVPLGDFSYGNLNGLHISRAIIDEDMGHVTVSQGTGSLAVASNSNLGATVQFYSADPDEKRRFDVRQSFGSFSGYRTFGRFDSGTLGSHGTRLYVAGVYQTAQKWKSLGEIGQHYFQINGKLTQPIGSRGMLTYFLDYSDRAEVDYQDLNKVWTKQLGYNWDNFGNWGAALQTANAYNAQGKTGYALYPTLSTGFPTPLTRLQSGDGDLSNDPEDAAYFGASGLRKDLLTYLSYKQAFTDHLTFAITGYGHHNDGRGLWFNPYLPSFDNTGVQVSPISLRTSEYGISRGGFVTSLTYETHRNLVEGGGWYEKETFSLARRFYGTTLAGPGHSLYDFPKNPFYTQWAYTFPEYVYQLHLQDTFRFTPSLSLSAGFKAVETHQTGTLAGYDQGLNLAPTATAASYAQGSLTSGKPFLPQFGADWKINKASEVFADAAYNVRAYQAGGNGFGTSPWGTSQAGFNALTSTLKPETSWTEEGGYRYTGRAAQVQASYFHVNFSNRLLAIQQGAAIAGNASLLSNVGGATTNGVDGAANIRIRDTGWNLYNAITFSRSTYDSDYTAGGKVIATGSKIVVDSPEFLYKNELSYRRGGFEGHVDSDIMGKRYFTYTDDNSVPYRAVVNFGTSYHRDEVGPLNQLKLQFNVFNLAGNQYYDTIGTNGFVASDPTSVSNNTLQVGFPRAFTGTLSARF